MLPGGVAAGPLPPQGAMERRRAVAGALFPQLARIGHAVAAPARLQLLELLCNAPRSVEALSQLTGHSVANTSQHLKVLRAALLVEARKDGHHVIYRLASEDVGTFYVMLRSLAASRLAEMDRILQWVTPQQQVLETADVLARIRQGSVTLLDVRPADEFRAGHLRGAVSIPVEELPARLTEVPRNRDVVAYCRGPYCTLAREAVELLHGHGYRAHTLDLGMVELRARRLPVDANPPESPDVVDRRAVSRAAGSNKSTRSRIPARRSRRK